LKVRQQTASTCIAIKGEFGRFPMIICRKIRVIKYWFRIMKTSNSLVLNVFNMRDDHGVLVNNWYVSVRQLLINLGYSYLLDNLRKFITYKFKQ
jgi:hypothetical protein